MSRYDSEDKNHLAMLAIPVILSMLLGFSGDLRAEKQIETEPVPTERVERENQVGSSEAEGEVGKIGENKRKDEIRKAVVDGDYDTFLFLTKDTPFGEIMTASAFATLRERYQHSQNGFVVSTYIDQGDQLG